MQLVGGVICVLVALWLVQAIVGSLQTQAVARVRSARSLALLDEQIAATRALRVQREQQHLHWNGYRKFRVNRKVHEAENVCSFYLVPHDGKPLPSFQPGQYLTFRFSIPGEKSGASRSVVRCYSLSEAPREDYFRVTVKRVPTPAGSGFPPGLISNHLQDNVEVGDLLDVQAPRGGFVLDPQGNSPVVLIGGGVGITPVLCMANAIIQAGSTRDIWLFYGVRCGREHAMKQHLQQLAEEYESFHLHVCYSCPERDDSADRDYHRAGHVSVEVIRDVLKVPNFDFYICGPPPMMNTLIPALEAWGVVKERIHMEAFGPATVTNTSKPKPTAAKSNGAGKYTIKFARSGKSLVWDGARENILDLALENNIVIDSGCRAGSCGSCEVAVRKGKVAYRVSHQIECGDGSCLTCVSVPEADLVLDA